ncbi:MAG: hypothetical protein L0Y44_03250 [Phycisphaerales bacterium]|nr:hypothetical protein [Phycisphaerales bacterium]MCI0629653.1 hypothetical protein [Phycisphaerales bacterium]MCI0674583.1 hypothetical protein [Phycisphaerales bacterium]
MRSLYTAIIHLREPAPAEAGAAIGPKLHVIRGVDQVQFSAAEPLITVRFDGEQAGLADIVRAIEDCGPVVTGVAQRLAN